jgi:hypothetical protein
MAQGWHNNATNKVLESVRNDVALRQTINVRNPATNQQHTACSPYRAWGRLLLRAPRYRTACSCSAYFSPELYPLPSQPTCRQVSQCQSPSRKPAPTISRRPPAGCQPHREALHDDVQEPEDVPNSFLGLCRVARTRAA